MPDKLKVVVAVSGASGMIYAKRLIDRLQTTELQKQISEIGIVFSGNAKDIWSDELGELKDFEITTFENNSFYVPFASGSGGYDALIVCPCSMGTLGRIAAGISDSLILRTADVMLKERKKMILVTREMPLNLIHINNMKTVTEAGGIICPASPTFYHGSESIMEIIDTVIERVLDLTGFKINAKRWKC